MQEVIAQTDPVGQHVARHLEHLRAVDRTDPESILRCFIEKYDSAHRSPTSGKHDDGTYMHIIENDFLKSAAAIARQYFADIEQMRRIDAMRDLRA